jgi:hypothetical protein
MSREKILGMFAVVLQQEHEKLSAKTPKKAKRPKSFWTSLAIAKTKTYLWTKCQSAKQTTMTVYPKT